MLIAKNDYEIKESFAVADLGVQATVSYLKARNDFLRIFSLENERFYQSKGIDLVVLRHLPISPYLRADSIEIKTDRYHRTGNYFFETVSNVGKGTPGCFMYTEADFLFYVFPGIEIHVFHMRKAREWFVARINDFTEKSVITEGRYETRGRLVSRNLLIMNGLSRVFPIIKEGFIK